MLVRPAALSAVALCAGGVLRSPASDTGGMQMDSSINIMWLQMGRFLRLSKHSAPAAMTAPDWLPNHSLENSFTESSPSHSGHHLPHSWLPFDLWPSLSYKLHKCRNLSEVSRISSDHLPPVHLRVSVLLRPPTFSSSPPPILTLHLNFFMFWKGPQPPFGQNP